MSAASTTDTGLRGTRRFWAERERLAPLVDRWELFNRGDLHGWVAAEGLPGIACGDFHRPEHLTGWKTLLPCTKDERAVVGYLASARPAFLAPVGMAVSASAALAAYGDEITDDRRGSGT